jgi:S-adenosylmethionine decarboxylase
MTPSTPYAPLAETAGSVETAGRLAFLTRGPLPDLAPEIVRQRLVVEGTCQRPIDDLAIKDYLQQLSVVTDMVTLIEPVTHRSDQFGWAGWIHWETSGAHFYAWEQPRLFFSVDIYTCKAFDPNAVVDFTADYFDAPTIVAREF